MSQALAMHGLSIVGLDMRQNKTKRDLLPIMSVQLEHVKVECVTPGIQLQPNNQNLGKRFLSDRVRFGRFSKGLVHHYVHQLQPRSISSWSLMDLLLSSH